MKTTIPARIDKLMKTRTYRELAAETGISIAYLSKLRDGKKTDPSGTVLEKLGLYKVVTYRELQYLKYCLITSCGRLSRSRGMCYRHYCRLRRLLKK